MQLKVQNSGIASLQKKDIALLKTNATLCHRDLQNVDGIKMCLIVGPTGPHALVNVVEANKLRYFLAQRPWIRALVKGQKDI